MDSNKIYELSVELDYACSRAIGLAPALADALGLDRAMDRERGRDLYGDVDLARNLARSLVLRYARELGIELDPEFSTQLQHRISETAGGALAKALLGTTREFAVNLLIGANLSSTEDLAVSPSSLMELVRGTYLEFARPQSAKSWRGMVSDRLILNAGPVFKQDVAVTAESATAIRLAALALAREADRTTRRVDGDSMRKIAAGITLLEIRARSKDNLESIILARA